MPNTLASYLSTNLLRVYQYTCIGCGPNGMLPFVFLLTLSLVRPLNPKISYEKYGRWDEVPEDRGQQLHVTADIRPEKLPRPHHWV